MSMVICEDCERLIDSDDDPECFIDVSATKIRVFCVHCRDQHEEFEETWNNFRKDE